MPEKQARITFKGEPLTLVGEPLTAGAKAPDVELLGNDLSAVCLSRYRGKVLVLASVPSLDTSVCSAEAHRFNEEATRLSGDVAVVVVSCDLPFAQKRWCGAEGVERVTTLSDHREAAFGKAYGVLIEALRLLARCVWVVDRQGRIKYVQLVDEMTEEPEYTAVLDAVKECL